MREISEHGSKCFGLGDIVNNGISFYNIGLTIGEKTSRMIRSLDPVDLSLSFNLEISLGR